MQIDRDVRNRASALAAAALLVAGCGGDATADGPEAQAPDQDGFARVINVEVSPVSATPFTERIRLTGTVEANRDVVLAAEESGRIEEILVEKGSRLRAGQPILRIDGAVLSAQVEQARSRMLLAQELWQRRKRLWEEDGVGTEQAYLEAKYSAEEAVANLEMLKERLERTTVRAPFAGVLDERRVELGEMVSPGTPVARMVDLDPVKITAGVPERYAPDVEAGDSVSVSFDVLGDRTFDGAIGYVAATVNPRNRTVGVEFVLPNPDRAIKPQMVADISVVRRTLSDALVVPQESLVRTEEGFRAFVVEEGDGGPVAVARDVRVGPAQENQVVVEEGLSPGESLIVVGQHQVAGGDRVRVVRERASTVQMVGNADTISGGGR